MTPAPVRPVFRQPFPEVREDSLTAVFQHVEHQLEALGPFVIGIGNMIPAGVTAEKLPHTEDPGGIRTRRRQSVHVLVVAVVHHHDHVEFPEVLLADLPGTVRQFVTAARRSPPHAGIGQFARVPGICPGRVDRNLRPEPAFADDVPHDSVGSRGAANIPQTNEKYLCFHGRKDSTRREECQIYRVVPCRCPSKRRSLCRQPAV